MTLTLSRLLTAFALLAALWFGAITSPAILAQDTATEVTGEVDEAVDDVQDETGDAADAVETETAQLIVDDDDFDDWGLIGLLGLLGLGGLLRKPDRPAVIVDDHASRAMPNR